MNIQFFEPQTLQEAARLLQHHGPDARPLAGGTDLVVQARTGKKPLPATLVHLGRIPEMNAMAMDEDGVLHLGARVSHAEVEQSPAVLERWTALADAAAIVGSPATRHIGTVGGNLCNGSPAMELGGPLLVFDARLRLVAPESERILGLAEFFVGPGATARAPEEVLAEVLIPPLTGRSGSAYLRLEFRKAMEIAVVGATAAVQLDEAGAISDCRLALTAVAPVIIRVREAEAALRGQRPSEDVLAEAGELARAAASPIDDVRAPAAYRHDMVKVLTVRALRKALERAG